MSEVNPFQPPSQLERVDDGEFSASTADLTRVRRGLWTVHYGLLVGLLGTVLGASGAVACALYSNGSIIYLSLSVVGLAVLVGVFLVFCGQVQCALFPSSGWGRSVGGRGVAIGAGLCLAVSLLWCLVIVLRCFVGTFGPLNRNGIILDAIENAFFGTFLAAFGSVLLFAVFLRSVNVQMNNDKLRRSASVTIGMLVLLGVGYGGLMTIQNLVRPASPWVIDYQWFVGWIAVYVFGLVAFVRCANLVLYTARSIENSLALKIGVSQN